MKCSLLTIFIHPIRKKTKQVSMLKNKTIKFIMKYIAFANKTGKNLTKKLGIKIGLE